MRNFIRPLGFFMVLALSLCHVTFGKVSRILKDSFHQSGVFERCVNPGLFALTFDDGPEVGLTESVLDILKSNNVQATFFVNGLGYNGQNFDNNQTMRDLLKRVHAEGHMIGSHTWSHPNLTNSLTEENIREELSRISSTVKNLTGVDMKVMRPPYGSYNDTVINLVRDLGYLPIMWNINTTDWLHDGNIEASLSSYKEMMDGESPSDSSFISLHHDPLQGAGALAQASIDYVKSLGYNFVTIKECLGLGE